MLQSMRTQRVRHDRVTELNWGFAPVLLFGLKQARPGVCGLYGEVNGDLQECLCLGGSSRPRDRTRISCLVCLADLLFTTEPSSVQFSSVQSLSHSLMFNSLDPMDCSTPGFPVHHQLPELTQTHVH